MSEKIDEAALERALDMIKTLTEDHAFLMKDINGLAARCNDIQDGELREVKRVEALTVKAYNMAQSVQAVGGAEAIKNWEGRLKIQVERVGALERLWAAQMADFNKMTDLSEHLEARIDELAEAGRPFSVPEKLKDRLDSVERDVRKLEELHVEDVPEQVEARLRAIEAVLKQNEQNGLADAKMLGNNMAQIQSRLTRIEDRLALYRPEDKSEENVHGIGPQIRALNWKVDGWAKTVERLDRKNESLRSLFRGLLQEVRGEKSVPSETKSCRACQGEPIAPWPPASGKGPTHHTCHPGEELDKPILPDDRLNDQPVKARLFDMDGFGVWVRWKNDINNESNLQYLRRLTELAPAMQDFIQGCQSTKSDYSELMDWVDSHIKDVLIEEEQGGPA